jgi:GrpB-like predicted nucleotidyltransferase (UPF0157 family)
MQSSATDSDILTGVNRSNSSTPRDVQVFPYNPHWPGMFSRAAREIADALGARMLAIHHIGSTSVPDMHAKPVIDMLAIVDDVAALDTCAERMTAIRYEVMGEFGIAGRRYYRRDNAAGERTHQVHAFAVGSPHVERHLAFRDFMRAHPHHASEYAQLKQRLAEQFPRDMDAYIDGKDPFIKAMEAQALAWAARERKDLSS